MALRGNLHSFRPSELLQFVALSKKTGTLRVYDEEDTKFLSFKQGALVYAFHQRRIPRLNELLYYRSLASKEETPPAVRKRDRWDNVVSDALARRRDLGKQATVARENDKQKIRRDARLSSLLVEQGVMSEDELRKAADPEGIPDALLEDILNESGVIPATELEDLWSGLGEQGALSDGILSKGLLSRSELMGAILLASDESLAEALVHKECLSRGEARQCLTRLRRIKGEHQSRIRLGQYLIATGRVSQRQLERALEEQLVSSKRLGEILIDHGAMTPENVLIAIGEIEALHGDFGPIYPLKKQFEDCHMLSDEDFTAALFDHEKTGQPIADILVESGKVTAQEMRSAVREVLIDEICDLFLWTNASFEFLENLSLEDATGPRDFPEIHSEPFPVDSLLLRAHSSLDELRQGSFNDFSLSTVFVPTEAEKATVDRPAVDGDQGKARKLDEENVLRSLDGKRSLKDLRRVLPGNRFEHLRMFALLIDAGRVRPLARREAYEAGLSAQTRGDSEEALCLLRHALSVRDDDPPASLVRGAIHDVRLSMERRPFQRLILGIRKVISKFGRVPAVRRISREIDESEGYEQTRKWLDRLWGGCRGQCVKFQFFLESILIRTGLARLVWSAKTRVAQPIDEFLGKYRLPRLRFVSVALALTLGIWIAVEIGKDRDATATASAPGFDDTTARRASVDFLSTGAPLEAPPVVDTDRVYLVGRDGLLRAVKIEPESLRRATDDDVLWTLEVGQFGDLFSPPLLVDAKIFLTNVRGVVHAVSAEGLPLWERRFSRLEPIRPTPLRDADSQLVAVVVVGRETAHVLDAESGETLHQFETGNRVVARPVGNAESLFVGSRDNHIYKVRWRQDEVVWDYEESDDVTHLLWVEDHLVFASRDGVAGALDDESGKAVWKRDFPPSSIRRIVHMGSGQVGVELGRDGIEVVEVSSGETIASLSPDPSFSISRVSFEAGILVYISESGYIGELSPDGERRWRTKQSLGNMTGWTSGSGLLMITTSDGRLVLVPTDDKEEVNDEIE